MEITNAELKNIKKLKDKKYRRLQNLFLVEGVKLCAEVLKSDYKIKFTLSTNDKYKNYPNLVLVSSDVIKAVATTETPQDIICVCEIPISNNNLPNGNSLILDELQDPGNIGTLIRSAVAFNFKDIYFVNTADIYSEKVIRASMGAIFKVNAHIVDRNYIIQNKNQICDLLIGTDLNSKGLDRKDKSKKTSLIIGNEGNGVSEELLNITDKNVTLKMANDVESLNAGVAGSILMYNIFSE